MYQPLYNNLDVQSGLDYLDEQLNGKPRSSLEEKKQTDEEPSDPLFDHLTSYRRDSGRSNRSRRHQMETYSPRHSPVRGQREQQWKLMVADDFDQIDDLFGVRDRLISETDMSSHIRTRSDDEPSSRLRDMSNCGFESSYPVFESENTLHEELPSFDDEKLIPDSCSLFGSQEDRMEECFDENLNIITNLQPVSVANEACQEEALEEHVFEQSAVLSMAPCPSVSEHEDTSTRCKHKPKPNSPAVLIKHRVKRKKKTNEQVEYLRELFFRLGGEWDGKVRKEAMRKTGLSRIQVYKWFFDMKLQQQPKEKRVEPEVRVCYPPEAVQQSKPSSELLNSGDFVPQPIFKIERVVRV